MTVSDLSASDLSLLRKAAVLAGAAVAITKYSGAGGTRDEFRGIVEGLEEAAARYPANPLIAALISDETRAEADGLYPQFRNDPTQKAYEDFKLAALNRCGQAADLLKERASPEQAAEFKAAVISMCEYVANRAKEGTVLGFGGTRVDPLELAMVEQVRRALEL
ncbi:MAG: hypothetical protein MUC34_11290 [Anaerolineae bacterium]|jgi:hypothetical protein|nr:hypothetical protein [Anaerolineae bacterium]